MAVKVFGIDLGTTYSCIACIDEHGKPVVLTNSENKLTTPSVVDFESPDNVVVGDTAKEEAAVNADRVVSTVKRAMGDPNWLHECHGHTYKPQEVSAYILRKLVHDAKQVHNLDVTDVVITCPAYFGTNQKEATRQAGEIAGLNVRYVIPEPTAAALAYGLDNEDAGVTLVYDLGGGTFDVTVISIAEKALNVVCTDGDHQLGGKDWDDRIVEFLATRFEEETGVQAVTLTDDMETYQALLNDAENVKVKLSSSGARTVTVKYEGERASIELTREKFEELTADLLERTISLTKSAISVAKGKGVEKIDKILLVGGSTFMPQVTEALKRDFSYEIVVQDPNQIVAKGAAIFGQKMQLDEEVMAGIAEFLDVATEEIKLYEVAPEVLEQAAEKVAKQHSLPATKVLELTTTTVRNVAPKSFGVVVVDEGGAEKVNNLVVLNDPVPTDVTRQFGTFVDGQGGVNIAVWENKSTMGKDGVVELDDCTEKLGEASLEFTKPLPANSPISVNFSLSHDGLLSITAEDLTTNQSINAQFQTAAVMNAEEMTEARSRQMKVSVSG